MINYGRLINLTPHPVRVLDDDGDLVWEIPPDGRMARLTEEVRDIGDGVTTETGTMVPVVTVTYGDAGDVPTEDGSTGYIVSLVTALALRDQRSDLLVPYGQIRSADGSVTTECRMLARVAGLDITDSEEGEWTMSSSTKGASAAYLAALKGHRKMGASRCSDPELAAGLCESVAQIILGAVAPSLIWDGAMSKGMTAHGLLKLMNEDPNAARDLMWL